MAAAPTTAGQQPSSFSSHGDNGDGSGSDDIDSADGGCSDEHFSHLLRQFDPTAIGVPDKWLVKLIRVRGAEGSGEAVAGDEGKGGRQQRDAEAASRSRRGSRSWCIHTPIPLRTALKLRSDTSGPEPAQR